MNFADFVSYFNCSFHWQQSLVNIKGVWSRWSALYLWESCRHWDFCLENHCKYCIIVINSIIHWSLKSLFWDLQIIFDVILILNMKIIPCFTTFPNPKKRVENTVNPPISGHPKWRPQIKVLTRASFKFLPRLLSTQPLLKGQYPVLWGQLFNRGWTVTLIISMIFHFRHGCGSAMGLFSLWSIFQTSVIFITHSGSSTQDGK